MRAGRTGRGPKGGQVLVQTLCPDAPAIVAALRHDLPGFAAEELPYRAALGYPPHSSMVRIVIRGPVATATLAAADELARQLHSASVGAPAEFRILGPAPAPMAKLRGSFRFQIQLHAPSGDLLRTIVERATADFKSPDDIVWTVDVDPIDMM